MVDNVTVRLTSSRGATHSNSRAITRIVPLLIVEIKVAVSVQNSKLFLSEPLKRYVVKNGLENA
jgi:hypothetical protein